MAKKSKAKGKAKAKRGAEAPWDHAAPGSSTHHKLTPAKKASAKRSAKKAGRPYPNLVDNMRAARGSKGKKSGRKRSKR